MAKCDCALAANQWCYQWCCLLVDLTPFVHLLSSDGEKIKGVSLHFSPLDLFKGKYLLMK